MYLESLKMNYEGWLWLYGSWIYNYLHVCNQCLSPLKLWIWISIRRGVIDTTLCDTVCQWLATGQGFSLCSPVSPTNKTDCHIAEILLVDHVFELWLCQTKDYKIGCFCTLYKQKCASYTLINYKRLHSILKIYIYF